MKRATPIRCSTGVRWSPRARWRGLPASSTAPRMGQGQVTAGRGRWSGLHPRFVRHGCGGGDGSIEDARESRADHPDRPGLTPFYFLAFVSWLSEVLYVPLLWLTLAVGVVANVFVTTFSTPGSPRSWLPGRCPSALRPWPFTPAGGSRGGADGGGSTAAALSVPCPTMERVPEEGQQTWLYGTTCGTGACGGAAAAAARDADARPPSGAGEPAPEASKMTHAWLFTGPPTRPGHGGPGVRRRAAVR